MTRREEADTITTMATFEVTKETIEVFPHSNADRLELARVGLYNIVVGKGQFASGDIVLYIPEYAVLPANLIEALGLEGKLAGKAGNRVKPVKLRGELSQGVVAPLSLLPQGTPEQRDYAEVLGVTKWEPEIPMNMSGDVEGNYALLSWIDVENLKKYPEMFEAGESVTVTEKIHGCLAHNTRVLLPDYSTRTIRDLVESEYRGEVLGRDKNGSIRPVKVLNTFDNGTTREWLRLTVKRFSAGRGHVQDVLHLTPNHRVFCPSSFAADDDGYVFASALNEGDLLTVHRNDFHLSPIDEQVLIGKMLGDATIRMKELTADIMWGQKEEAYAEYALQLLSPEIRRNYQDSRISGYGTVMHRRATVANQKVKELFASWYQNGQKSVPEEVISKIGPLALAFWYMDDGSLAMHSGQEDRAFFATNGFDEKSVDNLALSLAKFDISAVKYNAGDGWRLRLNAREAEKFFLLIYPHIPEVMENKLPERYRGKSASTVSISGKYQPETVMLAITQIEQVEDPWLIRKPEHKAIRRGSFIHKKYDLETETGNFFANNILVHNSATLFTFVNPSFPEQEVLVSSKGLGERKLVLKEDERNVYWRALHAHNLARLARVTAAWAAEAFGSGESDGLEPPREYLAESATIHRVAFFGETFGSKVQDLHYDVTGNDLGFALFDIVVEYSNSEGTFTQWLDPDDVVRFAEEVGVPQVPVLYEGPFDIEKVAELASGKEQVSGRELHIREGVVVRPLHRGLYGSGKTRIGKYVSEAYLLRGGNATEYQ